MSEHHPRGTDGPPEEFPGRTERRLRRALDDAATARRVDPVAMLDDLHARLDTGEVRGRARAAGFVPLLVAAAVLAVIGGGLALATLLPLGAGTSADLAGTGPAAVHQVDTDFSCAQTREVPLDGSQDEFVPDLGALRTPAAVAEAYDAPRYAFTVDGDRAVLRLGNADGSLGSATTYRRDGDGWAMVSAVACTGAGTALGREPTSSPARPSGSAAGLRLGVGDGKPWPLPRGVERDGVDAVVIDDRTSYTYAGLRGPHRTLYAQPCGRTLCLPLVAEGGSHLVNRLDPDVQLQRIDEAMLWPDDAVGRGNPYQLWLAWDTDRSIGRLSTQVDGETVVAQQFTDPTWDGARLFALLLPADVDADVAALGTAVATTAP